MKYLKPKILVVLGPTATGKSALAVRLAKAVGGEIISADSRQVYRGLDIGSGKITRAEMKGVPHHMLDVASPKRIFTVAEFQRMGQKVIGEILERGKLPIVCGGSGFYIDSLVDSVIFPEVLPNKKLRTSLEKKSTAELGRILKKIDPRRYADIDPANRHRLVRAIEIAQALGAVPEIPKPKALYQPLFIGVTLDRDALRKKIAHRLETRLRQGMIAEVKNLHAAGLSWKRLESFGLEYRSVARLLRKSMGKINAADKTRMVAELETNIAQFAKRQMVWFKRNKRIKWFQPSEWEKIKSAVKKFRAIVI